MTEQDYRIEITQGASWPDVFLADEPYITLTDSEGASVSLTGWSGEMVFAQSYDDEPFMTLTSAGGGIVIDGATGGITPALTSEQTLLFPAKGGVYQLKLTNPSGGSFICLGGPITVNRGF